ncbi:MAG: helix-turn-helix domain-containing protein [Proteobacteria bacterium]|nr:helix-turn-helix domain-containing protein [Pseudomonadota bacterium]
MGNLLRKNIASDNIKFYKSLGHLIKDYRSWRALTQEKFSELVGISLRELQNWEMGHCRARIENLHDLSEASGIPMQVCVALNAGQPLWYSLGERRFAYSSAETINFSLDDLFKNRKEIDDGIVIKPVRISTDKHIQAILSCHRDLYSAKKSLGKDVIKAATIAAPELNLIAFDSWGHYVGHHVCLPLKINVYQELKKHTPIENYLTAEKISAVASLNEGVFFLYSLFAASWNVGHLLFINPAQFYNKINQKDRFVSAAWAGTQELNLSCEKLGMEKISISYETKDKPIPEIIPDLYEIGLDALLKRYENFEIIESSADVPIKDQGNFFVADSLDNGPIIVDKKAGKVCPNPVCTLKGKKNKGNIVSNGTYRTKDGSMSFKFICKECKKSFCSRSDSVFYDLKISEDQILLALKLLAKGMPIREVADVLNVKRDTVRHWLTIASENSNKIDSLLKKQIKVSQAGLNALWAFAKKNALRKRAAIWHETKKDR